MIEATSLLRPLAATETRLDAAESALVRIGVASDTMLDAAESALVTIGVTPDKELGLSVLIAIVGLVENVGTESEVDGKEMKREESPRLVSVVEDGKKSVD